MSPPALALDPDPPEQGGPRSWEQRILWTLVGAVILNWSVSLFGPASIYWPITLLVIIAGLWGMALAIISWLDLEQYPRLERWWGTVGWANAVLVIVLMGVWTFIQYRTQPAYTTDELSFDQYAAQLVAHGLNNPYLHSMAPAGSMFRLSPDGYTYTLTGNPVMQLSYPSLSFLIYVPFILLGWTNEVGAGVNMLGWITAVLLMFWLLPRNLRPAVLVFASINVYLSFASGGVTDMLFIPLLVVAAYRWDRFGLDRRSYVAPVALGLAMAIKQTPWPVIVFLLCALACDEYDRSGDLRAAGRRAGRYLAVALGVFLVPNLPYLIASPSAWVSGVFVPFVKNLVPAGQGLVSLTLFMHLGGGSLAGYTVIFAVIAVLLVVVFVGTYPLMRPATFMLPSIAYFFASRSQTNYLISLLPIAIVGAITAGPAVRRAPEAGRRVAHLFRQRYWGWGAAALALFGLIAVIYTFSSSAPLQLKIVGEETTGYLGGIHTLDVKVHNSSDTRLTPGYTIQTQGGFSAFWTILKGPKALAPGQTATVELTAPNYPAEPGISAGFSVVAFTDGPATISTSHHFLVSLWRTATMPQAFDRPVPVGRRILLRVQVLNHFNAAIQQAGIPVYIGQQIYRSSGAGRGSAVINGHRPGTKGRVVAYTNRNGIATFYIVGTKPALVATSFSAHLRNTKQGYVYGSSGYTNVWFVKR
jgi:heme/copper-type cytochrome/quinol oxidase subunit 4